MHHRATEGDSPAGVVRGNCQTGTFSNFEGYQYTFLGKADKTKDDTAPDYAIKYMATGEILEGSTASSYDVALGVVQALCPSKAPKTST